MKPPVFEIPGAEGEHAVFVDIMNALGRGLVEHRVPIDGCLRALMLAACSVAEEAHLDAAAMLAWAQAQQEEDPTNGDAH